MFISTEEKQTFAKHFLIPTNTAHRQYEALRAYFVEGASSIEAARRFGYAPGSFRGLVHQFRKDPARSFFPLTPGPVSEPGHADPRVQKVIALRKQNLSIYDISRAFERDGQKLGAVSISQILKQQGFARLPRRRDDERPATTRPTTAEVADVRQLNLDEQTFRTRFGGLFLFLSDLIACDLDQLLNEAGFPGSEMIPAGSAMRSLLGLKLFGNARHSHVMSEVLDEGLALFAGLNVIPKRSFLTEYSCRIPPACHGKLMASWLDAVGQRGLKHGGSFDLDFHTIPFHGEDALLEKHYVSKRSRRQKGLLAFLAQDADTHVFCYANVDLRKAEQNDEILAFVDFWRQRTGRLPQELIFDSRLTTYPNLGKLNQRGVEFITLRRRSANLLRELALEPLSAWRTIELKNIARLYRTPRIIDRRITLPGYPDSIRQIAITDLGHEEPTLLLTNQLNRSAVQLIGRYAQRMIIENTIEDGIDFFHMDALSSAVAMKVNCDLQLTLMASGLYRLLGRRVGNGYERVKCRHIFRDLVNAPATVSIGPKEIEVRFQNQTMAATPVTTHDQMLSQAYGPENPILDPLAIPGRGAVTAAVLAKPAYLAMTDILFRKEMSERGITAEALAEQYTLTPAQAAQRLGVTVSAVRQAIEAGRLAAWLKGGRVFIDPESLAALKLSPRGPKGRPRALLSYRAGSARGKTMHVRAPGISTAEGSLSLWRRIGVFTGAAGKARFVILEPAAETQEEIAFGPFFVRGQFRVTEKINNTKAAKQAWQEFRPA